jgi:hypothetical protein
VTEGNPVGMAKWYLDGCALLNLYASKRFDQLAAGLGVAFLVTPRVAGEALYVFERESLSQGPQAPVDLSPLVHAGCLVIEPEPSTDEELEGLVEWALTLDEGEAEAVAVALCRGGGLVTDDRKAIRELTARSPDTPLLTTAGLLRRWAEAAKPPQQELREILLDIQIGGNFTPGRRDPDLEWWLRVLTS